MIVLADHRPATVSVLVTTYNWPDALEKVLLALASQTVLPQEIIVADDGSGPETQARIASLVPRCPVPLRHSWQPDHGFRAALSRNRAIAAATGDYIVLLDGDMVPHPTFIADHVAAAKRNTFVQGMRVLTNADGRDRLMASDRNTLGFFDPGIRRRRHTLRVPWLAKLVARASEGTSLKAIKTCNQGWWRSDLISLNGFDERYEGWGREDVDLAVRAVRAGIRRRSLRFAGLASHLYHPERHDGATSPNDALIADTLQRDHTRSPVGLDRHMEARDHAEVPGLSTPVLPAARAA